MCNVHVAVALATKDNAILWNNMQCAMSTWLEPLVVQIEQKIIWYNMQCAMCTWLEPWCAGLIQHPSSPSNVCSASQDLPEGGQATRSINNTHALSWSVQLCSLGREVVWELDTLCALSA